MQYSEYYRKCRISYGEENSLPIEQFYADPVIRIPHENFGEEYMDAVNKLSEGVKKDFDQMGPDPLMTKHDNLWKYTTEINSISNPLISYLEEEKYGCYLYVDKIYIYRTAKFENRESSYLWHYDNNPLEIIKNIIYLNDVNDLNSPFEFLRDPKGRGLSVSPTRTGTQHWEPAPNNSRITKEQIESLVKKGCSPHKVHGVKGTTYAFCNSSIHRANPVLEGYRDVINIRVKPTLIKPPQPVDQRWTTGFETSGAVLPDPQKDWTTFA